MPETPQINVSKISGGGGLAGTLFAVISMVIFLIGIPALRYFLVGAILVGCAAALVIRAIRRKDPETPCTLFGAAPEESTEHSRSVRPDNLHHLQPVSPLAH